MAHGGKLLAAIRADPRNLRFQGACRAARLLGFVHEGGKGSHRVFKRRGEPLQLNFQDRDGYVPPYQAQQLVRMIEIRIEPMKYLVEVFWSDDDEGYIAVVPDLPGCSAFGTTPEAAVHEIDDATLAWIAACRAKRRPGPRATTKARRAARCRCLRKKIPDPVSHPVLIEKESRPRFSVFDPVFPFFDDPVFRPRFSSTPFLIWHHIMLPRVRG